MSLALKIVAISAAVLVGIAVVAVLALFLIDWNRLRGPAEEILSGIAGRPVTIGHLDIDPGWTSRIVLRDLEIANADWGEAPHLARVAEARITVDTWSLLGTPRLPRVEFQEPELAAERSEDGKANWDLGPAAEAAGEVAAPDERQEFPFIGALVIQNGQLTYRDPSRGLDLEGVISTATGETVSNLELDLRGSLEERPVTIAFVGGSLLHLRESEQPYPFQLSFSAGETRISAEGTAADPVKMEGVDIRFSIAGPSMAEVFPIFGIPLPETAPYSLEGKLERDGQRWRFADFSGKVDDSDLRGTLLVDYTPERPYLEAVLQSDKLDFHDLAGLIGVDPKELGNEEADSGEGGLLPDTPIQVERLRAMDMDVRLEGERVIAQSVPITALDMRFVVRDGNVVVDPLTFFVAEGRIQGAVSVDARQETPLGAADLTVQDLDLRPFFQDSEFVQEMGGRFVGAVDLEGAGISLADMLGASNGTASLGMRDGSVSALLVEAAGLDLVEALALLTGGDVPIRIRCGLLDAEVTDGVFRLGRGVVDTTDSLLLVQGMVDLGEEALDIQIEAREKDFSLIDAAAPVRIQGPFADPGIAIGGIDPLPFFEMGEQKDIDCDRLLLQPEPEPAQ